MKYAAIDIGSNASRLLLSNVVEESGETHFKKAVSLGSRNPRLYYNYGLFTQQAGKMEESILLFRKGLVFNPNDPELNYVLALAYMQKGQFAQAFGPASVLKRIDPGNPNYQDLFNKLKIP